MDRTAGIGMVVKDSLNSGMIIDKMMGKTGKMVVSLGNSSNTVGWETLLAINFLYKALNMVKLAIYLVIIGLQDLVLGNPMEIKDSSRIMVRHIG